MIIICHRLIFLTMWIHMTRHHQVFCFMSQSHSVIWEKYLENAPVWVTLEV